MPEGNQRWLILAPAVFLLLWSGGYAVAKIGLQYAEPLTMLTLRYACVVVIMAVLFLILRPPLPKRRIDWVHMAIVGVLIQGVYFGLSYLAFRAGVAAGTVALIMSLQPILVGLGAPALAGETVGRKRWAGLVLGLAGTAIVILARAGVAPPTVIGLVLTGLALLGITSGSLWEKRFGLSHHPVVMNFTGFVAGLICVLPLMLMYETMQITWTWSFAGSMAYLVIGNSVIAVGLLLAMIRAGDVARVSALFFLVPPLAALIAWALLGEIMPPLAWGGMALAGIGVLIASRT